MNDGRVRWALAILIAATVGTMGMPAGATILPGVRWAGSSGFTGAIAVLPKDLNSAYTSAAQPPAGGTVDLDALSDRGGRSLRLALLAPVNRRLAIGAEVWADDIANLIATVRSSDGTVLDTRPLLHRSTWGLAWRADADAWSFPRAKSLRLPSSTLVATGTAGVWRTTDEHVQHPVAESDAFGWSLGLGWTFQLPGRVAVGPAIRYTRVFNDQVGRYVTGSLDWNWR